MEFKILNKDGFQYLEEGKGPVLLILHGLFGALSNFKGVVAEFRKTHRVIIPIMPIYERSKFKSTVTGLRDYVHEFVKMKKLQRFSLMGNSLGGHISLVYTLNYPKKIRSLILTGSSGLFESGMGSSFPKRGSYEYVRERVSYTFYSPKTASKELVDSVFKVVNDNFAALRILKFARSAQSHNMREEIVGIEVPTLLIWGLNDNITPPRVAHEFDKLIPNTELRFIDKCGHAPMMEQPKLFNKYVKQFFKKHQTVSSE